MSFQEFLNKAVNEAKYFGGTPIYKNPYGIFNPVKGLLNEAEYILNTPANQAPYDLSNKNKNIVPDASNPQGLIQGGIQGDVGIDFDAIRAYQKQIPRPVTTENGALTSSAQVQPAAVDPSTQLPPSAEQTMVDPTAYALQVYGQGQQAAKSKESMDAVRDLGLAIHRQKYPEMYADRGVVSMSPSVRATFPDRQTNSLENFVTEGYVQEPYTMIDNESISALASNDAGELASSFQFANMSPEQKQALAFGADMQGAMQEQIADDDVRARIAEVEAMLTDLKRKAK
tara:strand:- start:626 stop:1483 length:858 start_codon:yes stop_codon:yes gene_type:complete